MSRAIDTVLSFWFEKLEPQDWFLVNERIDAEIRSTFLDLYQGAVIGGLDDWQHSPDGALALVILLDQFPRNMFRGTADMYQSDMQAVEIARQTVDAGMDKQVPENRRIFFYLPFEHSEILADQDLCYDLVSKLEDESYLDYAEAHRRIIRQFGRFPHRNALLGRESTPEEIEFLKEEGSSF